MTTLQSIWPKISSPFVRAMLAGHSALGLAFAALIYLVCLTGALSVLAREFQRWEQPQIAPMAAAAPQAVDRALRDVLARYEGVEHVFINLPNADLPRITVHVDRTGENDPELSASPDGALIDAGEGAFTHFITRLHINLHLPQTWGVFIVGLTGVALLSSLVSGLFAHPRAFRDAFHLRWGGGKRLQEADLHNRIGVWGLPFHIVVSLTGALLGLSTVIVGFLALALFQGDMDRAYSLFLPPAPIDDPRPAPLPSVVPMFDTIMQRYPDAEIWQVIYEHPGEMGQTVTIYANRTDQLAFGDAFTFNGAGDLTHAEILAESSLGVNVLQSVSQLHFGWFGGWFVKIVYLLLGVGLAAVTSSGVAIWLARRRDKGRPAPRWERLWIATVWSQPFAYALCALLAVSGAGVSLLALWCAATLACAALLGFSPSLISRMLRGATAAILVATVAIHLGRHQANFADPIAWGLNGALLALAVLLAITMLKPAPTKR